MGRVKRIWYLSSMRAAMVQASLRIRAVSTEPPLLAHTSSESRGTFRQKDRSLGPLNGWACTVKNCHDGMLEDTNLLDTAQMYLYVLLYFDTHQTKFPSDLNSCRDFVAWFCYFVAVMQYKRKAMSKRYIMSRTQKWARSDLFIRQTRSHRGS